MNRGTFPDEERKQWVAKCPKCGEEFIRHKDGPQCQLSKCSDLDLQNKHEEALPLMVACALPQYNGHISVSVPKDWHFNQPENEGYHTTGATQAFTNPPSLEIPWYSCRIKGTFFNSVAHECGHISSIHAKNEKGYIMTGSSYRRTIRKFISVWKKDKFPFHKRKMLLRNPKVSHFWNEMQKHGLHWEDTWQKEYVRIHGLLMTTPYAKYNYYNRPPKLYPSSINFSWDW